MKNQHFVYACIVSYAVSIYPDPLTAGWPILCGVICGFAAWYLENLEDKKRIQEDE